MAPLALLSIFGPIIAQLIPQVTKLFDKKTETPEKIAAAQTVIDTIVRSTGAVNAQEAVEKIQTDPAALKEATKAVLTEPSIMSIRTPARSAQTPVRSCPATSNAPSPGSAFRSKTPLSGSTRTAPKAT